MWLVNGLAASHVVSKLVSYCTNAHKAAIITETVKSCAVLLIENLRIARAKDWSQSMAGWIRAPTVPEKLS